LERARRCGFGHDGGRDAVLGAAARVEELGLAQDLFLGFVFCLGWVGVLVGVFWSVACAQSHHLQQPNNHQPFSSVTSQPVASDRLRRRIKGVPPMAPTTPSTMPSWRAAAAAAALLLVLSLLSCLLLLLLFKTFSCVCV
jgi:hypothetical protein